MKKHTIIKSCGNVFEDLGLPNAGECFEKAKLGCALIREIEARELTQAETAEILKTDQAKVSALVNGKFQGFSLSRLIRFLELLGNRVSFFVERRMAEPIRRLRPTGTRLTACRK